jgi:DNA-binding response OmpR family regulator
VLRLRRKLEATSNAPRVILTERGVGYVFALPVEPL